MKKTLLFLTLIISSLSSMSQTSELMIVEKTDGTKSEIKVDEIKRVIFESIYSNPVGTVGNPIDLGLSVKWSSWNLGAKSYTEVGGYYGWGDSSGEKTSEILSDYPASTPPDLISGTEYDIVTQKWGNNWRIPTSEEIYELINACSWSYYQENGHYYLTGRAPNGNSLVIPVSGYRINKEIHELDNLGWYWSGTLTTEDKDYADAFSIDLGDKTIGLTSISRYCGLTIRPVYDDRIKISVSTVKSDNVKSNSATLYGSYTADKSEGIVVGFLYSTSKNLSIETSTKITVSSSSSSFSKEISGLNAKTTYYFCAFGYADGKYTYGNVMDFTTKAITTGTILGHDWVDLGLPSGIKWATCNVGGSSPSDYGKFYAWGCTSTSSDFTSWNGYRHWNGSSVNNIGSNISGNYNYDAARYNWGSAWRLPTLSEFEELIKYCTAECTTLNGVPVTKVTGPNGNCIYFPYVGSIYGSSGASGRNEYGYYWSGTNSNNLHAPYLYFQKNSSSNFTIKNNTSNNVAGNHKYGAGAVGAVTN